MGHLTQKGVLFSGFLMILQSETKTDWTLTRSLMFFSVDTMEDHKGGGCRPRGNFLRGGGEGRPSREIPSYTLLHILAEHDHVDQSIRWHRNTEGSKSWLPLCIVVVVFKYIPPKPLIKPLLWNQTSAVPNNSVSIMKTLPFHRNQCGTDHNDDEDSTFSCHQERLLRVFGCSRLKFHNFFSD